MKNKVLASFSLLFITGCTDYVGDLDSDYGDLFEKETSTPTTSVDEISLDDVQTVESISDMKYCTTKREGTIVYLEEKDKYYICTDYEWVHYSLTGSCAETSRAGLTLKAVIRDFQATHSDFENFSEESVDNGLAIKKLGLPGYGMEWLADYELHEKCGNPVTKVGALIGADGRSMTPSASLLPYLQLVSTASSALKYGECANSASDGTLLRGFQGATSQNDIAGFVCQRNAGVMAGWANDIYYTPGMVQTYLELSDMMNPVIMKAADLCDNKNFEQWFRDVEGVNLKTEIDLEVPSVSDANYNEFAKTYNNDGFFPLDNIDPSTSSYLGPLSGSNQFGAQSLSIYCPPYEYKYAPEQKDRFGNNTYEMCSAWLQAGGPKYPEAAFAVANARGALGSLHLRNYGFTMMAYSAFEYKKGAGQYFAISGNDDIWVYVDGVLTIDLGGTHLAAPGKIDFDYIGANAHGCHEGEPLASDKDACSLDKEGAWKDGSIHHLHIFYVNRQTEGSSLHIRSTIKSVASTSAEAVEPVKCYKDVLDLDAI